MVFRGPDRELYRQPLGSGVAEPFERDDVSKDPLSYSRDGRYFVYRRSGGATSNDIWIKPVNPPGSARPLIATRFGETAAVISPDSRWMAYESDESGESEIHVTSFPDVREKWPVSTTGGTSPLWSHDGRELFYLSATRMMMSVSVEPRGTALQFGKPRELFQTEASRGPGAQFIVTADGRFLVNSELQSVAPATVTMVFNWQGLLNR